MTTPEPVPLWLYGGSGLLAGELLRLLEAHPALQLAAAVSRKAEKADAEALHPHLASRPAPAAVEDAQKALETQLARGGRAAVVFALPHGQAAAAWSALRARLGASAERVAVVDLSADYRLRDPQRFAATYGGPHGDLSELPQFVYGLPELHRAKLRGARRVAAPGCFATAMQLAAVPAARAEVLDAKAPWILHGITGSSGSGAEPKPGTHHPYRNNNFWAYSLDGHRHEAELEQALEEYGVRAPLHFVAHSAPLTRGIHLTAALPLARPLTTAQARAIYTETFSGEPFVEVLESGVPEIRRVAGSNRACLGVSVRGSVLHVLVAIDNIVKGGSGQALQCLNLMLGFPETWGLPRSGLGVC